MASSTWVQGSAVYRSFGPEKDWPNSCRTLLSSRVAYSKKTQQLSYKSLDICVYTYLILIHIFVFNEAIDGFANYGSLALDTYFCNHRSRWVSFPQTLNLNSPALKVPQQRPRKPL